MPYITETIWQKLNTITQDHTVPSIMLARYPEYQPDLIDTDSESEITWLQLFILGIRNIRGEMNIAPKKPLPIQLWNATDEELQRIQNHQTLLKAIAKIESISTLKSTDPRPAASTALIGSLEILVPIADIIDVQAEIGRLQKEIEKHQKEFERLNTKLNNSNFILKAPKMLVDEQQKRVEELTHAITQLKKRQQEIQPLEA
jgi:valyl-tRNA synthetase